MASKFNKFAEETEFSGVKYMFTPERSLCCRIFWVVVFVCFAATYAYTSFQLANEYLKYPHTVLISKDRELIPLPDLRICTHSSMYIPNAETVESIMSDADVLLAAAFYLGLDITTNYGTLKLNRDIFELIHQIPTTNLTGLLQFLSQELMVKEFQEADIDLTVLHSTLAANHSAEITMVLLNRLQNLPGDVAVRNVEEISKFLKTYSLTKEVIKSCSFEDSSARRDCLHEFQTIINEQGKLCIELSGSPDQPMVLNKTDLTWKEEARLSIKLHQLGSAAAGLEVILLTDKKPFMSIKTSDSINIDIHEVETSEMLSAPYRRPCTSVSKGDKEDCVKECVRGKTCQLFKDSSCSLLNYTTDLSSVTTISGCIKDCNELPDCKQTVFKVTYEKTTTLTKESIENLVEAEINVQLAKPQNYIAHVILTDEPTASISTFVAEFGGNMGLFIGGSSMTIIHLIEFLFALCCCTKLCSYSSSKRAEQPARGHRVNRDQQVLPAPTQNRYFS